MIELTSIEKTYRKPKQPPVRAVNRVSLSVLTRDGKVAYTRISLSCSIACARLPAPSKVRRAPHVPSLAW